VLCAEVSGRETVVVTDDTLPLCENGLYHVGYAAQKALSGAFTGEHDVLVLGQNTFGVRCRDANKHGDAVRTMVGAARRGATEAEAPWISGGGGGGGAGRAVPEASKRLAVYRYHLNGSPGERIARAEPLRTGQCFDVNTDGGFHQHCHHSDLAPCDPRQTRLWTLAIDDSYREYFEGHEINHPMLTSPYVMTTHKPPDFPDLSNIEVVASVKGADCDTACTSVGRTCAKHALFTLNTCTAIRAYGGRGFFFLFFFFFFFFTQFFFFFFSPRLAATWNARAASSRADSPPATPASTLPPASAGSRSSVMLSRAARATPGCAGCAPASASAAQCGSAVIQRPRPRPRRDSPPPSTSTQRLSAPSRPRLQKTSTDEQA
jgi:hypothetical protein